MLVRDQTYLTSLLCCFVVTQEKWSLILAVHVVWRCSVLEKNLHILHMSCLRSQSQSSVSIGRHLLHAQLIGCCPGQKMPSNTALLANSHSFVCTLTQTHCVCSPSRTRSSTRASGWTDALCIGSQPLLSLSL